MSTSVQNNPLPPDSPARVEPTSVAALVGALSRGQSAAGRRRVVFIDVDGTLMDHEIIDPLAPAAIAAARANGHLVFVCTGRSINGIDPALGEIAFDGWVTSGGASARVGDVVVHRSTMGVQAVQRMIDFFEEHQIQYILESDEGVYCSSAVRELFETFWRERLAHHAEEMAAIGFDLDTSDRERFLHFLPLEQVDLETVSKATFISRESDSYEFSFSHLGSSYHLVPGSIPMPGGSSGEISALGITKATGIEAILAYLGMDAVDAIGIGDSCNDVEMFDLCGVAVAMGNASPELQAKADYVTTPVLKGGVRDALRHFGLID
ncbi:MAG: Cof-type HAD-IIB family hydrolase [Cellulomonadaceae bacterium]|nr:Cof-type HAD-IIB family hydrolase [Cellulomonadaceae bacterium]